MNELYTSNHSQMLIRSIPNPKGADEGLPVEFGQLLTFSAEVAAIPQTKGKPLQSQYHSAIILSKGFSLKIQGAP